MNRLAKIRPVVQGTFMNTCDLKAKVLRSFDKWLKVSNSRNEFRAEMRHEIYLLAELLLRREGLPKRERQEIEMILRIVE